MIGYSMNELYKVAEISKQAFSKQTIKEKEFQVKLGALLLEADILRQVHPGCGVEKMYDTLMPQWLGRDRFCEILMRYGYRVRMVHSFIRTTISTSFSYPNLIEGMILWSRNQLWQTDITYFKVSDHYCYLVFIQDVYTRRIIGYQASNHLRAEANIAALQMALRNCGNFEKGLIHHSDRGSQYIDVKYTGMLKKKGINISMGLKAQDNAYAERINGTIKNEYLSYWKIETLNELKLCLRKAVNHYNNKRIHRSLPGKITPVDFEQKFVNLNCQKRPTVIVYAEGNPKLKWVSNPLEFLPEKTLLVPVCPMVTIGQ